MFSASSALEAAAGAAAVKTGSGPAGTSAGPTVPSGQQIVSHAHVAAAVEPKALAVRGTEKKAHLGKKQTETTRRKSMDKHSTGGR